MSNELNEAKEAVLRFARAWTEWEVLMAQKKNSIHNPALKETRAKLIQDHCTPKKRVYVDGMMSFRQPPTYGDVVQANLMHLKLDSPTKGFVDFNSPTTFHRFVVIKKNGVWKIDSVKWKVISTDDWKNGLIGGP